MIRDEANYHPKVPTFQSNGRIFRLKDARQQASLGADNYASVN